MAPMHLAPMHFFGPDLAFLVDCHEQSKTVPAMPRQKEGDMKALWLGIVAVLVCVVPVWGQQGVVFYDDFETGDTAGWWAPARVGATGQVTCYDEVGAVIACAGTGQDGDLLPGVGWPNPRFVDNGDGTVVDLLTGLFWLKDASCAELAGTDANGQGDWTTALTASAALADGTCGLTDGTVAGQWRLPSRFELESLLDLEHHNPSLSNAAGTAQWTEGDAFSGVQSSYFWSSTSYADYPPLAWGVSLAWGYVGSYTKTDSYFFWPVRGGQ